MPHLSRIEFGSFKPTDAIRKSVNDCLESGWLTTGPRVLEFENRWKNLFNYKYARLLSSGTAADTAACMTLYEKGAKPGDEIICPALSFIATANAIRAAGFTPRFVDVKRQTLNIDETKIEDAITEKTRAIMAVNLMGRPCRMDVIKEITRRHNLLFIVDNCEAYGSTLNDEYALHYADIETSSHFTAHIVFGVEGGTFSTNDPFLDSLAEGIRSHGRMGGSAFFDHQIFGLNFKSSDLHASVALPEVEHDAFWNNFSKRKYNLNQMRSACAGYEDLAYFVEEDADMINAPHAFSITLKRQHRLNLLSDRLDHANISWKRNFGACSQHRCFSHLCRLGDFKKAEYIGDNGLHVGVHKHLKQNELDRICNVFVDFFEEELRK